MSTKSQGGAPACIMPPSGDVREDSYQAASRGRIALVMGADTKPQWAQCIFGPNQRPLRTRYSFTLPGKLSGVVVVPRKRSVAVSYAMAASAEVLYEPKFTWSVSCDKCCRSEFILAEIHGAGAMWRLGAVRTCQTFASFQVMYACISQEIRCPLKRAA